MIDLEHATFAARRRNVRPAVPTAVGLASEAALHGCRGSAALPPFTFHFSPITFNLLLSDTDGESADRYLNRTYRKLRGLLSADEQKALVEEERAWLLKRDATKSAKPKETFTTDRGNELQLRADKIVDQKSD